MNNTKEDILKINKNLDNIYNLIKKLKIDIDSNIKSDEIKEKINNTVFEIEETLKEDMNVETVEKRVLLISSKTQNVVLPYNQTDIKTFLETGKYKTQEEVIQNEYTLPLSKYKNEAISRVREGYNLARKKEKLSISESIKYALNLFLLIFCFVIFINNQKNKITVPKIGIIAKQLIFLFIYFSSD